MCVFHLCHASNMVWYKESSVKTSMWRSEGASFFFWLNYFYWYAVDWQWWRKQQKVKLYFVNCEGNKSCISINWTFKYKCPHSKNGVEYVKTYVTDIEKAPFFKKIMPPPAPLVEHCLLQTYHGVNWTVRISTLFWRNVMPHKNWFYRTCVWMTVATQSFVRYEILIWGHGGWSYRCLGLMHMLLKWRWNGNTIHNCLHCVRENKLF
jgi:hypothetical protein